MRIEFNREQMEYQHTIKQLRDDLNLGGLDLSDEQLDELFALDPAAWAQEADLTEEYFARFGDRLPAALTDELEALRRRIAEAS